MSATAVNNDIANSNNINFAIKDTKLYVSVVTVSAKDNQNLSKLLSKRFERSVYWNDYKPKHENKNIASMNIFSNQTFLKLKDCLY